tara:strand:+ start:582 stop:1457 length:876 start_codon:yes stop_codon:yes gene_type:complete
MNKPKVSILISTYGQVDHTKHCLRQLEKSLFGSMEYEILITDDNSKDSTVHFLETLNNNYRIFFNSENRGFSKNNNAMAQQARGEYLCFLNNDVFVEGDWLNPMIKVFENYDKVGIVGNVQKLVDSNSFDHMGVVFAPEGNPRHYGQGFIHRPFKGETREWSAVTAACCVIKKHLFRQVGGFDEVFVNGCEDVDLCLRLSEMGWIHYVVHDSVVKHVKGASDGRKTHNKRNSDTLEKRWGKKIRSKQAVLDQRNHAFTYFFRGIVRPWSINFGKWIRSISILLGINLIKRP